MNIDDFKASGPVGIARLANFFMVFRLSRPPGNDLPSDGVQRVCDFFEAHQREWPVTARNVHWQDLSGLYTAVENSGPSCSVADVDAAIVWLPDPVGNTSPASTLIFRRFPA